MLCNLTLLTTCQHNYNYKTFISGTFYKSTSDSCISNLTLKYFLLANMITTLNIQYTMLRENVDNIHQIPVLITKYVRVG